ncbi:hypothetical protein BDV19DRAFT_352190 [Aspergillus venezuelensis]
MLTLAASFQTPFRAISPLQQLKNWNCGPALQVIIISYPKFTFSFICMQVGNKIGMKQFPWYPRMTNCLHTDEPQWQEVQIAIVGYACTQRLWHQVRYRPNHGSTYRRLLKMWKNVSKQPN